MIYLIYGNKSDEVRKKVRSIISTQLAKKPDALNFRYDSENWQEVNLEELLGGQGLFVQKYIVVFDNLIRNEVAGPTLLENLKEFQNSEHIFIFLEGALTKEILKKFEKKSEKIQEISEVEEKKKEKFNVFSLTDALGRKDKKELWVLYQKALLSGITAEEVQPVLFWQVRAMQATNVENGPTDADLSPFVYKKSQNFAKNFSPSELHDISRDLVYLYHDVRRGQSDMETALEKFILGM